MTPKCKKAMQSAHWVQTHKEGRDVADLSPHSDVPLADKAASMVDRLCLSRATVPLGNPRSEVVGAAWGKAPPYMRYGFHMIGCTQVKTGLRA